VVELLVLSELGVDERHLTNLVRNQHFGLAERIRRDLVPLLEEETKIPEREPSPLIAALADAVAAAWPKTGWVDWRALAAAARRHKALPDVSSHHELVKALTDELGAHAPALEAGPKQRPGWSAVALFTAVNDHHTTTATFPMGWWWRHRSLRPALRVLPELVDLAPGEVPIALGQRELTATDRDRLTMLAAEPERLRVWFSPGVMTPGADDVPGH
jgi:hypothetical protein